MIQFIFLIFCTSVLLCYRAKKVFGSILNHYTLFTFSSFITLFYYYYHPLVQIKNDVYYIISAGVLFFDSTVLFLKQRTNTKQLFSNSKKYYVNPHAIMYVVLLLIILMIPFVSTLRDQIVNQGMELWEIRKDIRVNSTRTVFQNMCLAYVLKPFSKILMIFSFYAYFIKHKFINKKTVLFLAFIFSLLLSLIDGGGRGFLIHWIVFYFICSLFYSRDSYKKAFSKLAKFRLPVFIIPVSLVLIISFLRGIMVNEEFLNILGESYTLYIPLFDFYWSHYETFLEPHTFGASTFENIYLMINLLGKTLFGYQGYLFDYQIVDEIIQEDRYLGDGFTGMAHASFYFRFVRDWGVIGIALGPILLSSFYNFIYKFSKNNEAVFIFYVYCLIAVAMPPMEFQFAKIDFLLIILYLYFFRKWFFIVK